MQAKTKGFNIKLNKKYSKEQADTIGQTAVIIANSMLSCGFKNQKITPEMMADSIFIANELYKDSTGIDINCEFIKIAVDKVNEVEATPIANIYNGMPKA